MGLFLHDDVQTPIAPPPAKHRARSAPFNARRSITASAERVALTAAATYQRPYAAWQAEAWTGYERVGEVHYGFNMLANLLSRVRIYGAVLGEANEAPVEAGSPGGRKKIKGKLADDIIEIMAELQAEDFSGLIRAFSLNMSVPGECYLIHLPENMGGTWTIRSVDEVRVRPTGIVLLPMRGSAAEQSILPPDTYIARIWRRHPRFSREPDSSMVGVADSIEELLMLTRLVRGAARSRMNAGLLFIPDGLAAGASVTAEPPLDEPADAITALQHAATTETGGDFLAQLMESMTTPISDEGSASSVVPMLTTGPGELGAMIRHITFERKSDDWLVKRADNALNRILQGIDIPKEIVTGMESVKYSNAVVIDESLYKSNIEPLALVFVDAISSVYLAPRLKALGYSDEELAQVVVWYDPSEIVTRPNSADESTQGVDRMLLSPTAWRREHGYAESDAPTEEDVARLMLTKIARMPDLALAEVLKAALPVLMKDIVIPVPRNSVDPNAPQADPYAQQDAQDGPQDGNVVPIQKSQPAADPQRTAIKQVGHQ